MVQGRHARVALLRLPREAVSHTTQENPLADDPTDAERLLVDLEAQQRRRAQRLASAIQRALWILEEAGSESQRVAALGQVERVLRRARDS